MNPYAPPKENEPEDLESPRFHIIAPPSDLKSFLTTWGISLATTMAMIGFLAATTTKEARHFFTPLNLLGAALTAFLVLFIKQASTARRKRELLERPEASSGSALYGGHFALAGFRGWQGFLFVTREEAIIEIRQRFLDWRGPLKEYRLPLAEMELALTRGRITLPLSQRPFRFRVDWPKAWLGLIQDLISLPKHPAPMATDPASA